MASILVVYGTGDGQTATVASHIETVLAEQGHDVTGEDVETLPASTSPVQFDAVLVGSSIHVGKHHRSIRQFVEANRDALNAQPTAFFQLSMSSAVDDEASRARAAAYVDELLEKTGWHPDRVGQFGGALRYSKYGFIKRLMMKRIAKTATGDVDTSRDYEYTDWDEVTAFAKDFATFVDGRLGPESR